MAPSWAKTRPSPALPIVDTPRPFLPPSHYAAAAASTHSKIHNGADLRHDDHLPPRPHTTEPKLNRRMSMASISSRKAENRKSQAKELDILESLLLPSLNDTIGRMTQSSPRFTEDSHAPHLTHHEEGNPGPPTRDASFAVHSSHRRAETTAPLQSANYPNSSHGSLASQKSLRRVQSSISSASHEHQPPVSTPTILQRAETRKQLPTPDTAKKSTRIRGPPAVAPPATPTITQKQRVPPTPESSRPRTKSASGRQISTRATDSPVPTSRIAQANRTFMQTRAAGDDESSASDIETKYDLAQRSRSRLFVMNASTPSSSEVDSDSKRSKLPTLSARRSQATLQARRNLGLGIDVTSPVPRGGARSVPSTPKIPVARSASDASTVTLVNGHDDARPQAAEALQPKMRQNISIPSILSRSRRETIAQSYESEAVRDHQPAVAGNVTPNHWQEPTLVAEGHQTHHDDSDDEVNERHAKSPVSTNAKSPGRTPIRRDSIVNMPPSLRRLSVYGDTPVMPQAPTEYPTSPDIVVPQATDINLVHDTAPTVPPVASEDSIYSTDSERWSQDENSFSTGAEALFRRLTYKSPPRGPFVDASKQNHPPQMTSKESVHLVMDSSTSSLYAHDCIVRDSVASSSSNTVYESQETMSSAPPSSKDSCQHDRSKVIHDLLHLQRGYLRRLQLCLELFVAPLRLRDGKEWLPGVPTDVGRLFSWFQDIVTLHSHIVAALETVLSDSQANSDHFGHLLRDFVPRFEVYQPYLVRLPTVLPTLNNEQSDQFDELDEFIRIQQEYCKGSTLNELLAEPTNHLAQCLQAFKALLQVTPRDHADFIATFSLVSSTDMIMRVMAEVKSREDEYDLVKSFSSRIVNLPRSVKLAQRERRLLAHGELAQASHPSSMIYLFAFTDVLLLTRKVAYDNDRWLLVDEEHCLSRIVEADCSPESFVIHVAPAPMDNLDAGSISPISSVVTLQLRPLPDEPLSRIQDWIQTMETCARHTVRSLSFPTHSGRYLAHGPSVDLEIDTKLSVMSILASGLPFPKSPSIHIEEALDGRMSDDRVVEREERGWWALRFQQIMREMQRQPAGSVTV